MSAGEPTEWDLIQARIGNKKLPEQQKRGGAAAQYRDEAEVKAEREYKKWESAVIEKLDELEELDDESVLRAFREKRMAELQAKALRERFGELIEVSEPDYEAEVTNQRELSVVVFLFKHGVGACDVLEARLRPLAARYRATKFVKIRSDAAIRNYPDKNLPTLLVYRNGDIVSQLVTMDAFGGGVHSTEADVEWRLHQAGALEGCELDEDPREAEDADNDARAATRVVTNRIGFRTGRDMDDLSDDDASW